MSLRELQAKAAEIASAIAEIKSRERAAAIVKCREIMADNGLTAIDIGAQRPKRTYAARAARPALYRNAEGQTWAGLGKRPNWLRAQLSQGRSLDEFEIPA